MITMGIITAVRDYSIPGAVAVETKDGIVCEVRLPLFERPNSDPVKKEATFLYPPGMHGGYEIDDVVFVAFYNNTFNLPVILGKLYAGSGKSNVNDIKTALASWLGSEELVVSQKATLPYDTTVLGNNTLSNNTTYKLWDTLSTHAEEIAALKSRVSDLEGRVNDLAAALTGLSGTLTSYIALHP